MTRPSPRTLAVLLVSCCAAIAAGCGSYASGNPGTSGIKVAGDDPLREGANIFNERCAGCHSLDAAGAEGSAVKPNGREYKDGPNFNTRKENYDDVLYAIANGGFSSGPMPQNIVTGRQAEIVACFLATYSGREAARLPLPGKDPVTGAGPDDCRQRLAQR